MSVPKVEVQPVAAEIANDCGFRLGQRVVSRQQRRSGCVGEGEVPWSLRTSYPFEFSRGGVRLLMAERHRTGVVHYLGETMGSFRWGGGTGSPPAVPDNDERAFFRSRTHHSVRDLPPAFDQHKKPMRVTVTLFPADGTQFSSTSGMASPTRSTKRHQRNTTETRNAA